MRLAARAAHPAILQLNKGDDEKMATRLQVLKAEVVAEVAEVPAILQPGTVHIDVYQLAQSTAPDSLSSPAHPPSLSLSLLLIAARSRPARVAIVASGQ